MNSQQMCSEKILRNRNTGVFRDRHQVCDRYLTQLCQSHFPQRRFALIVNVGKSVLADVGQLDENLILAVLGLPGTTHRLWFDRCCLVGTPTACRAQCQHWSDEQNSYPDLHGSFAQATNSSIANVCEAAANDGADEAQKGAEDAESDEPLQNFGASTPLQVQVVDGLD